MHWSDIGKPEAPDREILSWARTNGYVVFTHDLDFGAILAATEAEAPSVLQLRATDVMPDAAGNQVLSALRKFESELSRGALISLDTGGSRVRLLPLYAAAQD